MTRGPATHSVTSNAGAASREGAVLRDVAVHQEPRFLPRPVARALDHRPVSRRSDDGQDRTGQAASVSDSPAETATSYQQGYRDGQKEAEAARDAAYQSMLESGHRAGLERGLEEGRQRGLVEGRDAGQRAVEREARAAQEATAARLAQLNQLLSTLPAELARRLASAEDDMVALCHAVVCRVLGEQLLTREGVAHCVRQAIHEASGGSALFACGPGGMTIHLHPRDLESMKEDEQVSTWIRQSQGARTGGLQWVADERVRLGGCMVHSSEGTLDARLEIQMAALRELLLRGRSTGPSAAPTGDGQPALADESKPPDRATEPVR